MNILAIDTTSEHGSVALRSNGQAVFELEIHSPDGFAHVIYQSIEQVLKYTETALGEIDCFATASGPGSFTGVRVGLSAVKGLAEATGKRTIGISNLEALASYGSSPLRAVVLDARRGEVYAAVYDANLTLIAPEVVTKFPDWLSMLDEPMYEFISDMDLPLEGTRFENMPYREAPQALADAVAQCAERYEWLDPAALDANYIRRADIRV